MIRLIVCISFLFFFCCTNKKTQVVWEQNFPNIGSQSSVRVIDINHDDTDDLILGACKNEYMSTTQGVLALNGKTGDILWQSDANDQVFGSATMVDINNDQTKDVIIGGRWSYLRALDGLNGNVIWSYQYKDSLDPILKYAKYNFYNSVLVPDQNKDGIQDLLIQNGGNHKAAPSNDSARVPGLLLVINSKTGEILAADTMPDGKETYMSPIFFTQPDGTDHIIYGSGGETLNGHLYHTTLRDLNTKNLFSSNILVTDTSGHGFIAPPAVADFNNDGFLDIASISHSSKITITDGKSFKKIWQTSIPNTESSNGLAIGNFNADDIPDVFAVVSNGVWPNSTSQQHIAFSGIDGSIVYHDTLGCTVFSSPIVYDLNQDGIDEVVLSLNEYNCERGFAATSKLDVVNKLVALNIKTQKIQIIDQSPQFKNVYATPLLSDLDHDNYVDIVYPQFYSATNDLISFFGMRIKRISSAIKIKKPIQWGGYMGSANNGILNAK